MDFEKKDSQQSTEDWLDEILGEQEALDEIEADEHAITSAGLTHPSDAEVDAILAENWDEDQVVEDIQKTMGGESFDTMKFDPVPEEAAAYQEGTGAREPEEAVGETQEEPPKPKTRPKRKRGYGLFGLPHLVVTAVWLCIIVLVGVTLGNTLWVWCADIMAFGKEETTATITISDADVGNIDVITQKLVDAGLIEQPGVFKFFAEFTGKKDDISAGTFTLSSSLDYNALIQQMSPQSPSREIVEDLLIPEGYTCARIFALLEEKGVCTVKELEEYAANGELKEYWFLDGVERGDKYCLEGFLFPDTYDFYTNDDPKRVLEKMLDDFDYRFTDVMKEKFQTLQERYANMLSSNGYDSEYITSHQLTLYQMVTMASMVQKEMATTEESFKIASVLYNRLTNQKEYPRLDCDATVYYAIGDYFWEKEELTQADLDFDSPYNTRKSQGLPPGPICNPGIYAIYAALDPDDTNFHYYVYSKEDRKHLFSETLAEHEQKVEALGY